MEDSVISVNFVNGVGHSKSVTTVVSNEVIIKQLTLSFCTSDAIWNLNVFSTSLKSRGEDIFWFIFLEKNHVTISIGPYTFCAYKEL